MFIRSTAVALALTLAAAGSAQSGTITLKTGITVRYIEAGPKNAAALLLLHGLGDTTRSWSLMLPELATTHHVYAFDQRGHGATTSPVCCYAIADLAYDAIAFMDAMKIDRAVVAGHSMGSFVAQHLAVHYPQRVDRLVLIGSSDTGAGTEIIDWLWQQAKTFDVAVPPTFVDEWQSNPTPVEARFLALVKTETAAVRPHVWRGVALTLMTDDHRRLLREINVPTLILWGEKDAAFPVANQERLQRAIPAAAFKAYPNVGHNLHWEIPAEITKDLRAFLSGDEQADLRWLDVPPNCD